MSTVTIAVDLAKNVFELAIVGRAGAIRERKRLSRAQFERFWGTVPPCRVVMEACSSSHFRGRFLGTRPPERACISAPGVPPSDQRFAPLKVLCREETGYTCV
jgi:hypothetical protein